MYPHGHNILISSTVNLFLYNREFDMILLQENKLKTKLQNDIEVNNHLNWHVTVVQAKDKDVQRLKESLSIKENEISKLVRSCD